MKKNVVLRKQTDEDFSTIARKQLTVTLLSSLNNKIESLMFSSVRICIFLLIKRLKP